MGQRLILVVAMLTSGCSFLFNPDNIKQPPADAKAIDAKVFLDAPPIDTAVDSPPPADADPTMLAADAVYPADLYEGQGDGNSRPALVVIHGKNFSQQGLTVTLAQTTHATIVGTPQVSPDGTYIAVQVKVPNDKTFASTDQDSPMISISETGASAPVMIAGPKVHGLPEIDATSNQTLDLATIDGTKYSYINVQGNVTFTGDATKIATLHVVSSITVTGTISANGSGGAAGPGGCAGGAVDGTGGCAGVPGGGTGGAGTVAGGGGGFNGSGAPGGGNGNSGGPAHGDPTLASLGSMAGNQSSGGGGGTQVAGGGGGGTVELVAGGDLNIGGVDVSGGAGAQGTSGALLGGSGGGGGGGGSGGVVLLRTDAGMLKVTMLKVTGGAGGMGGAAGAILGATPGSTGGDGASGRIRCDAPGDVTACTAAAHRGVSFSSSISTFQTQAGIEISLSGTTGDVVDFYDQAADGVHEGEPKMQTVANNALANLHVSLVAGYNKLCATLHSGTRGTLEADTCIELAYLP